MAIIRLLHAADKRLELFTKLTNHQLRSTVEQEHALLIAESEIAIRVAIAHGVEPVAFLLDERKARAMADVLDATDPQVPAFVLPPDEAAKLTGYRVTRGALCAMRRPELPTLDALVTSARRIVVLDAITDTSNVGAVFRNAAALGADAVIVMPSCADPLSRRAVRVSMGNVFLVPWTRAAGMDGAGLAGALRRAGFACLALALEEDALELGDPSLRDADRVALFFGSEGQGLPEATIAACDRAVIIPMSGGVDSLNVAASSAVAMWELFARR